MAKHNFYEWLELPVERFESDPAVLSPILEKFIIDWNFSKDINKQNRAVIYQTAMRTAIQNPALWKQIYDEYKHSVENRLLFVAVLIAIDNEIDANQLKLICDKFKVSSEFAKYVIRENGIIISDLSDYSIHSIEPTTKVVQQLKSIQRCVEELGYQDIFEFINRELDIDVSSDTDSSNIIEAFKDIKKRWAHTSYDGFKRNLRSNIDRICSGMLSFLKTNEIGDYSQFLVYQNVKDILSEALVQIRHFEILQINQHAYTLLVEEIEKHIKNKRKAEKIIQAFLDENQVGMIN